MAAVTPKKTFLEVLQTSLTAQAEAVRALPSPFKAGQVPTWWNEGGYAKAMLPPGVMLMFEEIFPAFVAVSAQLSEAIHATVPAAVAAGGSSSSSVIIDCAAFAETLEDLFIGERRLGKFWARWLVFHFLMGITPGFKWPDMDNVDLEGADVNTSYSLPPLNKMFSVLGMIRKALNDWLDGTFDDPDVIKSINGYIHLEGTALTGEGEFYDRTLVLVLTTGTATDEYLQREKAEKALRKADTKAFYREAAKKARQRARATAACEAGPKGDSKEPSAYTLARAAGISSKAAASGGARAAGISSKAAASGGARAGAGGARAGAGGGR